MVNRFAWHRPGLDEMQLSAYLINALLDMGACLILQDEALDYLCVTNLPPAFRVPVDAPPTDLGIFGQAIADRLASARKMLGEGRGPHSVEIDHESGQVFEVRLFCNMSSEGRAQYITIVRDRTAEHRANHAMNNLLLEINHRSKNMLAVIQSIANQTERHVTDIALFSRRLRGRIQSIARTQDLVTNSGWRGARLADVVAGELRSGRMQRFATAKLEGADIVLSAEAAMHVGLALHELVVLAEEAGGADGMPPKIHSRLENGARQVEFRWEDCGSGGVSLGREDFQLVRLLLQRIVPQALSGSGVLDETPDGRFTYQLSFPLA